MSKTLKPVDLFLVEAHEVKRGVDAEITDSRLLLDVADVVREPGEGLVMRLPLVQPKEVINAFQSSCDPRHLEKFDIFVVLLDVVVLELHN